MTKEFSPKKGDIVVEIKLDKRYRMKDDTFDRFNLEVEKFKVTHVDDCSPSVKLQSLTRDWNNPTKDKRYFGQPERIMNGWILAEYEQRLDDSTVQKLIKTANLAFKEEREKALRHLTYVDEMLASIKSQGKILKKELKTTGKLEPRKED
jgi:hypothetical protein